MKRLLAAALFVSSAALLACGPSMAPEDASRDATQTDALTPTSVAWHGTSTAALDQTTGSGKVLSVALPNTAQPGDVAFADLSTCGWVQASAPSGWTSLPSTVDTGDTAPCGAGVRMSLFWHVVQPSETAYAFTLSAAARGNAILSVYAHVDPTAPVDALANVSADTVSRTLTTPKISATRGGEKFLAFFTAVSPKEPATSQGSLPFERADLSSGDVGSWGIQSAAYESYPWSNPGAQQASVTFSSATDLALGTVIALHAEPSTPPCTVSDKLVPSCGAWFGVAERGPSPLTLEQSLAQREAEIGRTFDIVHSYKDPGQTFPSSFEQQESDGGRFLLINWKPDARWAKAASGQDDAYLRQEAQLLKQFGKPMFLALFHEPENDLPGAGTPADYVAMWHHVRQVFDQQGVTNVIWVWNMMGFPGHAAYYVDGPNSFYPGDAYVDWIASDPYNRGDVDGGHWRDFNTITNATVASNPSWPGFYTWATTQHPDKPLMLAEYGSVEDANDPTRRPRWFQDELVQLKGPRAAIKAVVYFDTVHAAEFRLDTPGTLTAFAELGADPFLNQKHP